VAIKLVPPTPVELIETSVGHNCGFCICKQPILDFRKLNQRMGQGLIRVQDVIKWWIGFWQIVHI
jgi:hypothetical protein